MRLTGATKDGSSIYFFHKISNAYSTGGRKLRKIQGENRRWHKTGKTKPVVENGVIKGYKKIMVLYSSIKHDGKTKSNKSNWVMHQLHLGTDVHENIGDYLVSKVFYQNNKNETRTGNEHVITGNPPPLSASDDFIQVCNTF